MNLAAFVSLEDISDALPAYEEVVISVEMDEPLRAAYAQIEDDIKAAISDHHGNASVISTAMNALLLYPDRPFQMGTLFGYCRNEETGERERFVISELAELDEAVVYAKERRLVEECKRELAAGRKVQVFAVYTQKRDVTRRLQDLLRKEGIRVEVLRACSSAGTAGGLVRAPIEERDAGLHPSSEVGSDRVWIRSTSRRFSSMKLATPPTSFVRRADGSLARRRGTPCSRWGFRSYAGTAQESCG
jgi:hypothetical protein